jgi:FixJ family two-component response regulator
MSGYTEDVMVFQQLLDIGALLIQKPFYPQDLLRMVRRAIEHPSAQPLASGHFTVATDES